MLDHYVRQGYAVVATDYQGLGAPGLPSFLQGAIEAHGALDILRAARQIEPALGTRYVVIGHSQGGQARLFTATLGRGYTPELAPLGTVAFAPASHIADRLHAMVSGTEPSSRLG